MGREMGPSHKCSLLLQSHDTGNSMATPCTTASAAISSLWFIQSSSSSCLCSVAQRPGFRSVWSYSGRHPQRPLQSNPFNIRTVSTSSICPWGSSIPPVSLCRISAARPPTSRSDAPSSTHWISVHASRRPSRGKRTRVTVPPRLPRVAAAPAARVEEGQQGAGQAVQARDQGGAAPPSPPVERASPQGRHPDGSTHTHAPHARSGPALGTGLL
mmetsp:Transcript_41271/g.110313  ORF Transcript_41271/g.110313 Transcript_41271/m.110313 type:complete len:214 (-) Transcript_41271:12-653(-)